MPDMAGAFPPHYSSCLIRTKGSLSNSGNTIYSIVIGDFIFSMVVYFLFFTPFLHVEDVLLSSLGMSSVRRSMHILAVVFNIQL